MARSANGKKIALKDLLFDPGCYLFDTLPQVGQTRFLVTSEQALAEATFADIRFQSQVRDSVTVATRDLVGWVDQSPAPRPQSHFIFHHAFVCSTLLARCLDQIDAFFSLKEPWILRRLADIKREHGASIPPSHWRAMHDTYFSLLAKNYATGQALAVKVTNVANNLIADIAEFSPDQKILYLYSNIESFLISNLKKPPGTRDKMPGLLATFLQDSDFKTRHAELFRKGSLDFLQTCALIWVNNIYALRQQTEKHNYQGLRTLDMDYFLTNPGMALDQVSRHFGHKASADEVALMTHPDVMGRNAKDTGHQYGVELREQERQQVYNSHQDEIRDTLSWIEPIVDDLDLYGFLGRNAFAD